MRRNRAAAAALAVVAVIATGAFLIGPASRAGDPGGAEFPATEPSPPGAASASGPWTASPVPVSAALVAEVEQVCREDLDGPRPRPRFTLTLRDGTVLPPLRPDEVTNRP